ncbi:MAG: hypothetical protein ACHP84_04200 [Caulobacterales bacterium]
MGDSIDTWFARRMDETPPRIDQSTIPKAHRQRAQRLESSLRLLTSLIEAVSDDVALFDYAEAHSEVTMKWTPIACRDAAMNIWAFRDTLAQILTSLSRIQGVSTPARESLQGALSAFTSAFPDAKDMRDVVGHPASHIAAQGRGADNAANGVLIQNSWAGRKVMNTYEGREISFELSAATLETLQAIRKVAYDAFRT